MNSSPVSLDSVAPCFAARTERSYSPPANLISFVGTFPSFVKVQQISSSVSVREISIRFASACFAALASASLAAEKNKPRCSALRVSGRSLFQTSRILSASASFSTPLTAFGSFERSASIHKRRAFCSQSLKIRSIVAASPFSAATVESMSRFISS